MGCIGASTSKLVPLLLLTSIAPAALAVSPPSPNGLTVNQFDQLLSGLRNQSDGNSARQISGLRLTERAGSAKLAAWESEFRGDRARKAILAIADASVFLHPPATDIPALAAPERSEQEQMLDRTIEYVKRTLHKLPDFSAQRSTTSFEVTTEDRLVSEQQESALFERRKQTEYFHRGLGPARSNGLGYGELFWLGTFSETVTYRGGAEVAEVPAENAKQLGHLFIGLTTTGEFGPVLGVVLLDAPRDKYAWDHWEKGANGPLAVFRYAVPEERSHYSIELARDPSPEYPAYDGEIAVNPSSGAVLRITVHAALHEADFVHEASILVEFGPTQIGGMNYICPLRGVAMTKIFDIYTDLDAQPPPFPIETSINDVAFTNYHVFRSNSRVITDVPQP